MADPEAAMDVRRGNGYSVRSGAYNAPSSPVMKYPLDLGNSSSCANILLSSFKSNNSLIGL